MTATALHRRRRPAYFEAAGFPAVKALTAYTEAIREEAILVMTDAGRSLNKRDDESWILPVVPEPEDRGVLSDAVCARARSLAPTTAALVSAIPYVTAYAISKLVPGKHIAPHSHWNPFLSAILCLQGGSGCYLIVDGLRHQYEDGGLVIFDYTLVHEARNEGREARFALLVAIDRRSV